MYLYVQECVGVCVCVCACAQLCPTLSNSMNYSPPGSSPWDSSGKNPGVGCHFLLQAIFPTCISCIGRLILYHWATWEAPYVHQIRSDQSLSRVWLFTTPWITAHQASLSITNSRSSLRLTSTGSLMPSSHLILRRPLLLLPPIPPSIRVFSSESTLCNRWPKYWSFSFSIIPSKEIPGLISFRMEWLDLLAVQGTLKSLLQYHSSKASILWHSAFFTVQLAHPYMTTGKTIALTRRTFTPPYYCPLLLFLT